MIRNPALPCRAFLCRAFGTESMDSAGGIPYNEIWLGIYAEVLMLPLLAILVM